MPAAGGVHELAAARAAAGPDVVAVMCGGVSLSYGGLEERANRLAHYLRGVGVGGESVVGLCLERGAGMVVAMLAVWKAGGAYLPLDPALPGGAAGVHAGRQPHDAGARRAGWLRAWPGSCRRAPWWPWSLDDPVAAAVTAARPAAARRRRSPRPLACVMYTSGFDGAPKGTQVTHGSLAAVYAGWASAHFGPGDAYRWLSLASASFDVFTGDLVRALCSGGTLVLGPVGLQLSAGPWAALLARERISALECAPRYADELAAHLDWPASS